MKRRGNPLDMFAEAARERAGQNAPLATRMRPRTFDEFIGQDQIVGPGKLLRRSIEEDRVPSMILWGPPGTGKTTLARIVAAMTGSHFETVSAVSSGVADLRRIADESRRRLGEHAQRSILFIDEIHRFNKAQQDVVLPLVEEGTITLVGATTENPSFEVISALLSRSRVFRLESLTPEDITGILKRALADSERGLGDMNVEVTDETLDTLANAAAGDARIALNALELAAQTATPGPNDVRVVGMTQIEEALQRRAALYDRAGDWHYDIASALIKSLRGSDPDAALYWLARMIEGGEDPLFIARRLVILASEDVGLADPHALSIAVAAQQAVHFIGMPEGFYPLAEATLYLATAPKSNSVGAAFGQALEDARATIAEPVPLHLRNAVTPLMQSMGYGREYQYDHERTDHYSSQQHLPDGLRGRKYYKPGALGYEVQIREWMERLRKDVSG
ncbi:MAG: replication-associated recombination protein A [Dehalococcoidia bacterium]